MMKRGYGSIFQMAYLVPDIEAAARHWAERLGVGPFVVMDHVPYSEISYRGQPSDVDISLAFAYSGAVQIELVQQHNEADSVFRDFQLRNGFGLHHVGAMANNLDNAVAALAEQAVQPVQRMTNNRGTRTIYFDSDIHPGAMLEIIEESDAVRQFFSNLHTLSIGWDGSNPIRRRD